MLSDFIRFPMAAVVVILELVFCVCVGCKVQHMLWSELYFKEAQPQGTYMPVSSPLASN